MPLPYLALAALFSLFTSSTSQPPPPSSSSSFTLSPNNRSSQSEIAIHGDVHITDSAVTITSRGRIMYRKPIRFPGPNPSFSTNFSFSVPSIAELTFSLVPTSDRRSRLPRRNIAAVRFVASSSAGVIEIDIAGEISVTSSDVSGIMHDGEKLLCWIDYDGGVKRVEVSLGKAGDPRPIDSLISYAVDLSVVLLREGMLVGISGNSTRPASIYSWSFVAKHGDGYLMHSQPLDPQSFDRNSDHLINVHPWRLLVALLLSAACGLAVVFTVLFVLSAIRHSRIARSKYPESVVELEDEKMVLFGERGSGIIAE